ncbi:hypothetical protein, partial [Streptomyces sp. NPDC005970]|uniref:hypothetical protein n=1 Tax=Streptomyces sp. NPDC005970 TaxID=3156723 RepID=UPI0033DF2875
MSTRATTTYRSRGKRRWSAAMVLSTVRPRRPPPAGHAYGICQGGAPLLSGPPPAINMPNTRAE